MSSQIALEAALRSPPPPENRENSHTTIIGGLIDEARESAHALCREVYDHPQAAAITAGVALAGAAALFLSRGQMVKGVTEAGKDVLLVEDTAFMGQAMKSALETNGEHVTWLTAVSKANPLTGTTLEGQELVIDPKMFKVALVDGELEGSCLQGEQVVNVLQRDGLRSIGTSSVSSINDLMKANGASLAAPKPTILSALVDNKLDFYRAVRQPAAVQTDLDRLTFALKGPAGSAMRQRGNALLAKFMT